MKLFFAVVVVAVSRLGAQTLLEHSAEARFRLDLHVPQAALDAYLPAGWASNVAAQGPAKDANPVKDPSGANQQMIIGGLTADPADAPGPFGNYLPAVTNSVQLQHSAAGAQNSDSQDWVFAAASGERIEMHIRFERGVGNRGNPSDVRFYSAKNPGFYQIPRQEQVLDILRNVTTNPPDRVKEFSFKASGGSYAKLFDGTERPLSWDNIIWLNRSVFLP